jgi:hypothetical protein
MLWGVLNALTRNLGRRTAGVAWLRDELGGEDAPDIVFAQEVLPGLLTSPPSGYHVIPGLDEPNAAVGCTSALLVRSGLSVDVASPDRRRPFGALGTYAATARLRCGDEWVWLVSVHASPSTVPQEKRRPDFETRTCEVQPWWADAFLAELRSFAGRDLGGAIIAGDLNEARGFDHVNHSHVCGGEFFDGVGRSGFVDATSRDWDQVERPTRLNPDYQLDRVLVSKPLADSVVLDQAELVHDAASDHAAVRFRLSLTAMP